MRVSKDRGDGVTVRVWTRDGDMDPPAFEHSAMTWADIDRLAAERDVPAELILVEDDARGVLGER